MMELLHASRSCTRTERRAANGDAICAEVQRPYGADRVLLALQGLQEPLFALTSGATAPDRVIDELRQYDFEIISTNLPEEQEKQLREAFAQE